MTPRLAVTWALVAALIGAATAAVAATGLPSPPLFAGLIVGIAVAAPGRVQLAPPGWSVTAAQAGLGVTLGTYVHSSTLSAVAAHWLPVLGVTLGTLALTIVAGLVLARLTRLDRVTASFGMIAGGASGIIAIAHDLGADDRQVAVMQYLRVVIIVVLTPIIATTVFGSSASGGHHAPAGGSDFLSGAAFTVSCALVGVLIASLTRLPAGSLLGPMLVAAVIAVVAAPLAATVPTSLQYVSFAVIGLQVGLRFTPDSLRAAGRTLPAVVVAIFLLLLGCAALGLLLSAFANVSELDAYLATTPGGLYAVLATAIGSSSNSTFVLAAQTLRLFVMLLAAPPLARWLAANRDKAQADRPIR